MRGIATNSVQTTAMPNPSAVALRMPSLRAATYRDQDRLSCPVVRFPPRACQLGSHSRVNGGPSLLPFTPCSLRRRRVFLVRLVLLWCGPKHQNAHVHATVSFPVPLSPSSSAPNLASTSTGPPASPLPGRRPTPIHPTLWDPILIRAWVVSASWFERSTCPGVAGVPAHEEQGYGRGRGQELGGCGGGGCRPVYRCVAPDLASQLGRRRQFRASQLLVGMFSSWAVDGHWQCMGCDLGQTKLEPN